MMIDPKHLRQLTEQAIIKGKQRHQDELARIEAEKERQERKAQLFAAQVIEQIPGKCEREASNERSHAVVMGLKWDRDYKLKMGTNDLYAADLFGPGAIVWKYCFEAGLKPSLEYWWSGDGMESGHNIVVHW